MKKLLFILPLLLILSWCSKTDITYDCIFHDKWIFSVCYIDIVWQSWDAITSCDNSWAYIWKVCNYYGDCIGSWINDDKWN